MFTRLVQLKEFFCLEHNHYLRRGQDSVDAHDPIPPHWTLDCFFVESISMFCSQHYHYSVPMSRNSMESRNFPGQWRLPVKTPYHWDDQQELFLVSMANPPCSLLVQSWPSFAFQWWLGRWFWFPNSPLSFIWFFLNPSSHGCFIKCSDALTITSSARCRC